MKSIRPITSALLQSSTRAPSTSCRAISLANASTRSLDHERQQRRAFFGAAGGNTNPFGSNQTLTAQRTLPYPSTVIYDIISDVASYSEFLPYCRGSIVTKYSEPAQDGKKYPEEAKLIIGFNDNISEEFTSRVYCVPGKIVEAVSGNMKSTLSGDEIAHHSPRPAADQDPSRKDTVMAHLLTRWSLKPYPYKPPPTDAISKENAHKNTSNTNPVPSQHKTEVNLAIEFQFSNPLYAAVAGGAAPKVADKMIEAFEKRVKEVMVGSGHAREDKPKRLST
ncbi:Putative coenzyme Q-binding protein COQ10 [Septoria linicola]|uniref:Coenzyme Q-binding protein COQ10 n=1 Tax=Septoria linicola TaxID=215465 RepID=A0A9Q9EPP5_9PEZI|nr:putative coenzyme Q-binding protein COQ10 [Septoria linicola]USW57947.1 Putative coenzyme Q-binding protein COQ10 [Septoria linicola]